MFYQLEQTALGNEQQNSIRIEESGRGDVCREDSSDFVPGAVLAVTPEFEDLVSALRQDLSKLGSKLRRDTYRDTD